MDQAKDTRASAGIGIAIGAGVGLIFGIMLDQIALGVALGAGLGVVFGSVVDLSGKGAALEESRTGIVCGPVAGENGP